MRMMKQVLWILAAAAITAASAAGPEWRALKIGGGGYNLKLAFDPSDPDRIYLAIDVAGIIRSEDCGESWRNDNPGLHGLANGSYSAGDIAVDSRNSDLLYASWGREFQPWSGIIRSTDRGRSWRMVSTQICGYGEGGQTRKTGDTGILIDPADSEHLYAIDNKHDKGAGGLWESRDGGVNWTPTGLTGRKVHTIRFHPGSPRRIYAACGNHAVSPGGFMVSADGGKSWQERGLTGKNVINFQFDPARPETIYAVAGLDGFFRSDDDGVTWRELNGNLPLARDGARGKFYEYIYRAIAADPFRPGRVIIGADPIRAYYESTDGGENWRKMSIRCHAPKGWMLTEEHMGWHTGNLYFHPTKKDTLFMTDFFGTWKSSDNGANWAINPFGQESSCMTAVLPDRSVPGRLYLGIWDHFMLIQHLSPDGERTERSSGLFRKVRVNKHLSGIIQLPDHEDRMIAVTNSSHCFVSTDRGSSWKAVGKGLPEKCDYRLGAPLAGKALTAYLPVNGTPEEGGGVHVSRDGGESWNRPANQGLAKTDVCGPYDPRQNIMTRDEKGTLRLVSDRKLYVSDDEAESWREIATPAPAVSILTVGDELLLGTENGLWASRDGGAHWEKTSINRGRVRLIAACGERRLIYSGVALPDGKLEYHLSGSTDGGRSYRELLSESLPVWNLQGIAIDPHDPATVYANTYWCGSWRANW